jgi:hypothetical protein
MRFFDCQRVEHSDDIGDPVAEGVGVRVVRLITTAVTARIDQLQPVIALQGIDITALVPVLDGLQQPVLQSRDRDRTAGVDPIADTRTAFL